MSVTIADFPAYRIYKPYTGRKFSHGDKIAIPYQTRTHGIQWTFYTLGTVEGYAIANGECPHKALKRHEANKAMFGDNRKRYWANQNAVVVSNMRQEKAEVPGFNLGDEIVLQGHRFLIMKAPNNNIELEMIGEVD